MRNFNDKYSLVRALNAVPGADSIDIYLNGSPFFNDVDFTQFTPYVYVPEGSYKLEVFLKDQKENALLEKIVDFRPGELVTLALIGQPGNVEVLPVVEESQIPTENKAKARFIHLVPNGRAINILLNGEEVASQVRYKDITPYLDLPPSTYQVEIELAQNGQLIRNLRVTLSPNRIYTFYALGDKPNFQIFQSLDGATFMN